MEPDELWPGLVFAALRVLICKLLKVSALISRSHLRQYFLVRSDLHTIDHASSKSICLEQIWKNRVIWDLTTPLKVCLGWNDSLCNNWCVSVGLKYTLVNKWQLYASFLKTIVSIKSMEFTCIFDWWRVRVKDGQELLKFGVAMLPNNEDII